MFIQPNGRRRNTNSRGKATGPILMCFGALIFLTVIHRYAQHVLPNVRTAQAAPDDYGYHRDQVSLMPADDLDERNIRAIIAKQTHALKHKNFAEAMSYSSVPFPEVTPAMFRGYLQARYPENAAPRSITFSSKAMTFEENFAIQRVRLTGQDGTTINETYLLIKTDLGWRVRRFHVLRAGDASSPDFIPWDDRP